MNITRFRPVIDGPEAELEELLIPSLDTIINDKYRDWWAGCSLTVGASRPDILLTAFEPIIEFFADLSNLDIDILGYLHWVRRARSDTVSSKLNRKESLVRNRLKNLENTGIVNRYSQSYSMSKEWKQVLPTIISIELKISNWKRAIEQAILNRVFSNYSYIAIPDLTARKIQNKSSVKELPIGIISISVDGYVEIVKKSPSSTISFFPYYYHIASNVAKDRGRNHAIHSAN